jgi:hypothetical protein
VQEGDYLLGFPANEAFRLRMWRGLCSGSPADSPNQVHLQSNFCTAAGRHNVKCLDLTPIFPRQVLTVTCYLESIRTGDQMILIEIKPHRWGWKAFESPASSLRALFCSKPFLLECSCYAQSRVSRYRMRGPYGFQPKLRS